MAFLTLSSQRFSSIYVIYQVLKTFIFVYAYFLYKPHVKQITPIYSYLLSTVLTFSEISFVLRSSWAACGILLEDSHGIYKQISDPMYFMLIFNVQYSLTCTRVTWVSRYFVMTISVSIDFFRILK